MKRFAAALTALVLALCLSPCAYALVTLEKPDEAQMVYLPADDYESYRADFYLSALTAIERDGDDLRLLFPSSRIVLRGFFATNDTRRALRFAGGGRASPPPTLTTMALTQAHSTLGWPSPRGTGQ